LGQEVLQMSPARKNDVEEERLAALEEIGIEEKALVYDEAGDKLLISDDISAIKDFYARAFQEWSLGNVEGTAEEIFDAVITSISTIHRGGGCEKLSSSRSRVRSSSGRRGLRCSAGALYCELRNGRLMVEASARRLMTSVAFFVTPRLTWCVALVICARP
jgi:hypothetical protein